jgi:hypothetical protein
MRPGEIPGVFSGTGFSLWGLVLATSKPHGLKPVPLETQTRPRNFPVE